MKHKLESRLSGEISTTSDNADDTTLIAESEEELKGLLMKVKEESKKVGFKIKHSKNKERGIQSHRFMANRWGNKGNSDRFYIFGFQITAEVDCSHEIKGDLFLGKNP